MLSPENPNYSPEVLGTTCTHPLLLLTLAASVSASASVTVTISSNFFFFHQFPSQSQRSVDL